MAEKRNPSRIQPPAATHQTSGTQSIKTPQRPCSNAPVAMHQRPKSETRSEQEHDNGSQHQRKQTLWPQQQNGARNQSLCLFVASAAEALARRRREGEAPRQLPPVQLIVVPFANLGPSLQDWGNQFYHQVAASHFPGWECERSFPHVLYAERTWTGGAAPGASDDATPAGMTPRASGTCPKGHMLFFFADSHSARGVARHAWCNVCGRDLKRGDRRGNCAACDWDVCMLWPVRPRRGATTGGGGVGV